MQVFSDRDAGGRDSTSGSSGNSSSPSATAAQGWRVILENGPAFEASSFAATDDRIGREGRSDSLVLFDYFMLIDPVIGLTKVWIKDIRRIEFRNPGYKYGEKAFRDAYFTLNDGETLVSEAFWDKLFFYTKKGVATGGRSVYSSEIAWIQRE